ncbi:hypothetical protein MWU49_10395 [Alcanivorax sp. S6407]|uniref:hypothetical protein n=1 Tax=Alcanivorax sp. S6407 TaxID=2926424 RepID=UPI001FF5C01E|nr:hypothetical protein [Alcanivorax sp. S6407]MCK0154112.1 hypothetical protein [Alcanivorax sp. S6407]
MKNSIGEAGCANLRRLRRNGASRPPLPGTGWCNAAATVTGIAEIDGVESPILFPLQ